MITARKILLDEFDQLRTLRLESLQQTPEAFASSYEEEVIWTTEVYQERQKTSPDNFIIGAFVNNTELIGMAGFAHERFRKCKHIGILWGMYVKPEYRGQKTGELIMKTLIENVRTFPQIEQINLGVVSTLTPAIKLYENSGFVQFGSEKNAFKNNGIYSTVLHYTLFLS